jgi:hypothetical protein
MNNTLQNNIVEKIKTLLKSRHLFTVVLIGIVVILLGFVLYQKYYPKPGPKPVIKYDLEAQAKLLDRIENRRRLSENDQRAKAAMLSLLPSGQASGIVHQEPTFRVEYVESADLFTVEILEVDYNASKTSATYWFLSQGMSQQGICNAPVQFFINEQVKEILRKSDIEFDPQPPNC